jgi:hypothetical protein
MQRLLVPALLVFSLPSPSSAAPLGLAERERGRAAEAKSALARAEALVREAVAKSPRSLALRLRLAGVLADEGSCDEARSLVAQLPSKPGVAAAVEDVRRRCPSKK